ncbi:hypothetical protein GmHk_12G034844 [Glycine max]|nr:hypothetical protein GmHk_12G034844 [Glycine max]
MAHIKKTGQMTSEAAKQIADKIDVLTTVIGQPEYPSRVRAVGASVTIKQYFELAPRTSRTSSSMAPEDLEQLTQQIRDQLEESITEKGLTLPSEPEVGPSAARVSTKESCVDPSGNDPDTGDSDKCGLYIKENPPRLVALGKVYEGSTTVHNIPLLHDQVKVGVEEVKDADAPILVPTEEVKLVEQELNTFLACPTHLVKRLSEQEAVGPAKSADRPDHEVDDPLYLMTLTIPQLFLKSLQNLLCLSNNKHMTETSVRAGNSDVYGFLDPQSVQRSGQSQFESESYMKNWMQNSKRDVYLGVYLNGAHWQMVVILPKENLIVWFCSLHNRPDNYLKGIINSALKGLDDTPQPKSKVGARWIIVKCNRQKGSTECGYYVMHWMSTIILGSFKNNWEIYFNDVRPLESEILRRFASCGQSIISKLEMKLRMLGNFVILVYLISFYN